MNDHQNLFIKATGTFTENLLQFTTDTSRGSSGLVQFTVSSKRPKQENVQYDPNVINLPNKTGLLYKNTSKVSTQALPPFILLVL